MMNCLFCSIAAGDIPSDKVYEDDRACAFRDISPQAPVHLLVIPKEHIGSVAAVDGSREAIAGHLIAVAAEVARQEGLASYRVVSNCGADAGQSVEHLHFHVLGGRELGWPPG